MKNPYYDGCKLLSMLDIDGKQPEIYMVTTNRTGGKTTYFGRLLVNKFLTRGEKFALLYRFNYEIDDVSNKFFKDIKGLFFRGYDMTSRPRAKGIYHELFLHNIEDLEKDPKDPGTPCGYAIALNAADQIKKYSHLFSDVGSILFDEFQSETNHYCSDEVKKFLSVHISIARGQGKQSRRVPVYMCGNPVSILNPYYISMGITPRLRENTNFLRGRGYVLEQGYNTGAAQAQKDSAFLKAFSSNDYVNYSSEGLYLNDNKTFIDKPSGYGRYLGTLRFKGQEYGILEYAQQGIVYCNDTPDLTYPNKLCVTTEDHNINYVMLMRNNIFITQMRNLFERGCFRFKNLQCKEAILAMLSY